MIDEIQPKRKFEIYCPMPLLLSIKSILMNMPIYQLNVLMRMFTRRPNHRDMRFSGDDIMITNDNDNYVFLYVFIFLIVSILLMNINPQEEIFHNNSVYTASKYRDMKLDTYRRITQ